MTKTCTPVGVVLESKAIERTAQQLQALGHEREMRLLTMSDSTRSKSPVKKQISQVEHCLHCDGQLTSFGTCRLYSGWTFDLLHCPACKVYYSKKPQKPSGPYTHQAFTFAQIKAETGGIYA